MTIDPYIELACHQAKQEDITTLSTIMQHANDLAESAYRAFPKKKDYNPYPEYEIRFTQFMERMNLTDHEKNLLIIQQDFVRAYQTLHIDANVLNKELFGFDLNVSNVVYALRTEGQLELLTDGLEKSIIDKYCGEIHVGI